jgi:hypothetical protein
MVCIRAGREVGSLSSTESWLGEVAGEHRTSVPTIWLRLILGWGDLRMLGRPVFFALFPGLSALQNPEPSQQFG